MSVPDGELAVIVLDNDEAEEGCEKCVVHQSL